MGVWLVLDVGFANLVGAVFQKDVEEGNAIVKMTNDTPVPIQPGSFGDVFQVTAVQLFNNPDNCLDYDEMRLPFLNIDEASKIDRRFTSGILDASLKIVNAYTSRKQTKMRTTPTWRSGTEFSSQACLARPMSKHRRFMQIASGKFKSGGAAAVAAVALALVENVTNVVNNVVAVLAPPLVARLSAQAPYVHLH